MREKKNAFTCRAAESDKNRNPDCSSFKLSHSRLYRNRSASTACTCWRSSPAAWPYSIEHIIPSGRGGALVRCFTHCFPTTRSQTPPPDWKYARQYAALAPSPLNSCSIACNRWRLWLNSSGVIQGGGCVAGFMGCVPRAKWDWVLFCFLYRGFFLARWSPRKSLESI